MNVADKILRIVSASPSPIKVQGNTAFMSNKWYRNTQKKETEKFRQESQLELTGFFSPPCYKKSKLVYYRPVSTQNNK